ncbi:MAG: glycosyltransferase family 2 protein [Alphaproteobacteria bacterium]
MLNHIMIKEGVLDNPLISIGITYYRASDTIEKAVSSALAQTWENIEVIIVDDFSNDGQEYVLDRVEQQHSCVRVVRCSVNRGVAAARNEIICHAKGEFLAFFDDDDESLPERIEKQYERIVAYERDYAGGAFVICHSARMQRYPDGTQRYEQTIGTHEGVAPCGWDVALRILTGRPRPHVFGSMASCSQMARLSTYKVLGGFDEDFRRSEDTELNVRAALRGAHFPGIDEPLVDQMMTLTSDKALGDEKFYALQVLEKHKKFIERYAHYAFCRAWLEGKYDFLQRKYGGFLLKVARLFLRHPVLTMQRFIWALPNIGFNLRFIRFYHGR